MIGYLYIVSNPQMHGENCFKIGFTSDLKRRMEEFNSATINIGKFEHHGHIICKDVEIVEKRVHRDLEYFRVVRNKEFFKCHISIINDSILNKSEELIIENHLVSGIFCIPQGKKWKNYFETLENEARDKGIEAPPRPPKDCIGGPFCGCTTYLGKSYEKHRENYSKIVLWIKKNGYEKRLKDFVSSLEQKDICYDPY